MKINNRNYSIFCEFFGSLLIILSLIDSFYYFDRVVALCVGILYLSMGFVIGIIFSLKKGLEKFE
jgi:hypothetical protein